MQSIGFHQWACPHATRRRYVCHTRLCLLWATPDLRQPGTAKDISAWSYPSCCKEEHQTAKPDTRVPSSTITDLPQGSLDWTAALPFLHTPMPHAQPPYCWPIKGKAIRSQRSCDIFQPSKQKCMVKVFNF